MEDARDEPLSTDSDMPNGDLSRCDTSGSKQQVVVIDANGSNWHRSPILSWQEYGSEMKRFSAEGEERAGIPAVLDFDLLCATIAMEREPVAVTEDNGEACEVGVQRMWEGGVLDCMDNKEIALQTLCCPSITYGKNLQRAGFGSSIAKGGVHFLLLFGAFISYVLFMCDYGHQFLYLSVALLISVAAIASYYRIRIRRRFNIKGSESDGLGTAFDDSLNHFVCGWCTLCQEARTLEMNNVQDGNWHGRGDTIWVGGYAMPNNYENLQPTVLKQPVVVTISTDNNRESDGQPLDQHEESSALLMHHQQDR